MVAALPLGPIGSATAAGDRAPVIEELRRNRHVAIVTTLAFGLMSPWPAWSRETGPIAPNASASQRSMTLYVELVVNRVSTGRIVQIEVLNGDYLVPVADLNGISLPPDMDGERLVNLSRLQGVETEYDSAAQELRVSVPSVWLPRQQIDVASVRKRTVAQVSPGMLINYDIYASAPSRGSGQLSVWTEERLFNRWGTLVNTGVYHNSFGQSSPGNQSRNGTYLRYDTSFTFTDLDKVTTYTAGDLVTGALAWNTPIRLGGIAVSRDFTSRPDIVTYPLPQFSGQAAVPTAVDLLINGSKVATSEVAPGPFVFNELPFVNGAGQATVVTTDALGKKVETSVPFYIANTLLRPGLWDYSVSAGAIRRGYGIRSFAYGDFALSGSARYGVTSYLTLEGHVETTKGLELGGLGMGVQVAHGGVIDASVAVSNMQGDTGRQYSIGYTYSSQRFAVSIRHLGRTSGFRELASFDLRDSGTSSLMRANTQANVSINLGRNGGTIGAAYFDVDTMGRHGSSGANISYMRPLPYNASLFAMVNKTFGSSGVVAQAQFIIPLGSRSSVGAGLSRSVSGSLTGRAQYSRSVPTDDGFGFNLGYATGDSGSAGADVTWRNRFFQSQGGIYRSNSDRTIAPWGDVQGSIVVMGGAVLPANRISDAFALIDTQGMPGVPVRYENQPVGTTDRHGHLLVPWAPSFYPAKYEIDPLGLSDDAQANVIERHVAIRNRAGARIVFPVRRIIAATIALVDETGEPVAVGRRVVHQESGHIAPVGWNGETYFEGLVAENLLDVTLDGGQHCQATFRIDVASVPRRVGPLTCRRYDKDAR